MNPEKIGLVPPEKIDPAEKEQLTEEFIWAGDNMAIRLPDRQAIPNDEGTHLQIVPETESADWRTANIKEVLKEGYYALPVARLVADSGRTHDLWANIHLNSRPAFVAGINVFGRKPTSETGWAKPVVMRESGIDVPENRALRDDLSPFAKRYLSVWEKHRSEIGLFKNGVNEMGPDSPEFQAGVKQYAEKEYPWQETVLWANNKFVLVSVDNPHLNGIHLVIHPRETYWQKKSAFTRPWQAAHEWKAGDSDYVEGFLESLAIIKSCQKILSSHSDQVQFANPEIHYSGNWAKGLQPEDRGGTLDLAEYLQAVSEADPRTLLRKVKIQYQAGGPKEFATSMHGHLYATRDSKEFVHLPSRPKTEVPQEWEGIHPAPREEVEIIRGLIKDNLTPILEQEASGRLYD